MKSIWITVYPRKGKPKTTGLRNWKELEEFLRPLREEATVRDQTGRLRFNYSEAAPGVFGLALSNNHPQVIARVKARQEEEARRAKAAETIAQANAERRAEARENQSSPAATPAVAEAVG